MHLRDWRESAGLSQRELARAAPGREALSLKASVHYGPSIAVDGDGRLDYFGTTVNVAARLCALSAGTDLLISEAVRRDAEISDLLAQQAGQIQVGVERPTLRGIEGETFEVCRIRRG